MNAKNPAVDDQTCKALSDWLEQHGYMPTVRELGDALGISSTAAAERLTRLMDLGRLDWPAHPGGRRQAHTMRLRKETGDGIRP